MLKGVDLSHWQTDEQFRHAFDHMEFLILKASEAGITKDKTFKDRIMKCIMGGKNVGAYHFWNNSVSGLNQAKNFCGAIKQSYNIVKNFHVDKVPYLLALDIENCIPNKKEIEVFCEYVKHDFGNYPVLYMNASDYKKYYRDNEKYKYWIASWGAKTERIFSDKKVIIHQYASDTIDYDICNVEWRF